MPLISRGDTELGETRQNFGVPFGAPIPFAFQIAPYLRAKLTEPPPLKNVLGCSYRYRAARTSHEHRRLGEEGGGKAQSLCLADRGAEPGAAFTLRGRCALAVFRAAAEGSSGSPHKRKRVR